MLPHKRYVHSLTQERCLGENNTFNPVRRIYISPKRAQSPLRTSSSVILKTIYLNLRLHHQGVCACLCVHASVRAFVCVCVTEYIKLKAEVRGLYLVESSACTEPALQSADPPRCCGHNYSSISPRTAITGARSPGSRPGALDSPL